MVDLTTDLLAPDPDVADHRHRPVAAGVAVTMLVALGLGAFSAGWRSRARLYRLTGF